MMEKNKRNQENEENLLILENTPLDNYVKECFEKKDQLEEGENMGNWFEHFEENKGFISPSSTSPSDAEEKVQSIQMEGNWDHFCESFSPTRIVEDDLLDSNLQMKDKSKHFLSDLFGSFNGRDRIHHFISSISIRMRQIQPADDVNDKYLKDAILRTNLIHQQDSPFLYNQQFEEEEDNSPEDEKKEYISVLTWIGVLSSLLVSLFALFQQSFVILSPTFLFCGWVLFQEWRKWKAKRRRRQNTSFISEFAELSLELDELIQKCIRIVQETELLSRGYKISSFLAPVSHIEQQFREKKSTRLRFVLVSVLDKISLQFVKWDKEGRIREWKREDDSVKRIKDNFSVYCFIRSRFLSSIILDEDSLHRQNMLGILPDQIKIIREAIITIRKVLNRREITVESSLPKSHSRPPKPQRSFFDRTKAFKQHLDGIISRIQLCEQLMLDLEPFINIDDKEVEGEEDLIVHFNKVKMDLDSSFQYWDQASWSLMRVLSGAGTLDPSEKWRSLVENTNKRKGDTEDKCQPLDVEEEANRKRAEWDVPEENLEADTEPIDDDDVIEDKIAEAPQFVPSLLSVLLKDQHEHGAHSEQAHSQRQVPQMKNQKLKEERIQERKRRNQKNEEESQQFLKNLSTAPGEEKDFNEKGILDELKDVIYFKQINK
eukprot:TRINITY_DN3577_c1_g1_i2.p1 TRINITY_DN3577_c1_g1~~TRINITY_DN3577_c1_g1_i2.p1  ORF type:complete len:659 (+),score=125.77 TRINITY_DN3577_c1_g1_i2:191-2167(+)